MKKQEFFGIVKNGKLKIQNDHLMRLYIASYEEGDQLKLTV